MQGLAMNYPKEKIGSKQEEKPLGQQMPLRDHISFAGLPLRLV